MAELYTRQTLFERIKNSNSEEAWNEYISYYKGYIIVLLKSMNISVSDREDLLQEILVKCWKKLPDFDYCPERGRFRSWLTVVVRNTVRDFIKTKAQRKKQLETELTSDDESVLAQESAIEKMAEKEWQVYLAELAWETVQKDFKSTLTEAFIRRSNGESLKSVATSMGIAECSVSAYYKRVQQALIKEVIRLETFLR